MYDNGAQGEWETVVPEPCKCVKPLNINKKTHGVYSVWKCKCGKRWMIDKWNTGISQRDGEWPSWVAVRNPMRNQSL